MPKLEVIGFDADDTLWENETFYRITQDRFAALLGDYADPDHLAERVLETERRNIKVHGYGIKGFTLSLIETAIEVTDGTIPATTIREILAAGQELLRHPLELLPNVREVLEEVSSNHRIIMITKGDLFDQERKLAQSGLGDLFDAIEIVSEKHAGIYARAFGEAEAMMVGNSVKSDVIPAIEAGAWGVHVPHDLEWVFEKAELPIHAPKFRAIDTISALPDLITQIQS